MFSIHDIRRRCVDGKIKWTVHASKRILQRGIDREDVLRCIMEGEIIEEYPDYWLGPAGLVFGKGRDGKALHVVAGVGEFLHIVTVYYPDSETFEADMKTRKGR